jgi:hypothetical protein
VNQAQIKGALLCALGVALVATRRGAHAWWSSSWRMGGNDGEQAWWAAAQGPRGIESLQLIAMAAAGLWVLLTPSCGRAAAQPAVSWRMAAPWRTGQNRCMRPLALAASVLAAALGAAPLRAQSAYQKSYASDMAAFLDEAQKSYPFFDLKDIRKDWRETSARPEKEARRCKTDAEFIALVQQGIACLRDAHMEISKCAVELEKPKPEFWPGVSLLPATDQRVVVMNAPQGQGAAALRCGTVVLTIDGKDARQFLEQHADEAWKKGGSFSSPQRARLFEYRLLLRGERGAKHVLEIQDGQQKKKVELA